MGNDQMDKEAARAVLFEGVYVPSFVKQCVARGVEFPDEDSLVTALQTVNMQKQAEAEQSVDLVKEAYSALVQAAGMETPEAVAAREAGEKQASTAAGEAAGNDLVKKALATLAKE